MRARGAAVALVLVGLVAGAALPAAGAPGLAPNELESTAIDDDDGGAQLTVGLVVIAPGTSGASYRGDDAGAPSPVRYEAIAAESRPPGFDNLCLPEGVVTPPPWGWIYQVYAYDTTTGALLSNAPVCVPFPDDDTSTPPGAPTLPVPPTITEIWRSVPIPPPPIVTDPRAESVVGLETRVWSGGPRAVQVAVSLRGFTVSGVARLVQYRFDAGDGIVTDAALPGDASAPAVRHVYRRKGARSLRVASVWRAELTLAGPGIDTPVAIDGGTAVLTVARDYPVVEIRSVLLP